MTALANGVMALVLGAIMLAGAVGAAGADTIDVPAGSNLQQAIDKAADGDILNLATGIHAGAIKIDKPLTLSGPEDRSAIVDGSGVGRSIWITAPDVTIRHLTVRGSGLSLFDMDAAIFLDRTADRGRIEENNILDNLIGIYVWGPKEGLVLANRIIGRTDIRRSERGNGVQLWRTPGTKVIDNVISAGRDGIFTMTSKQNLFRGNHFDDVRFAVHYMYTNDSEVSDNTSVGNDVGYAIMYSNNLVIRNNVSDGAKDHGLLFNFANGSDIAGNVVRGGDKCVFIYNANKNRFTENRFEDCRIGVHFTAGSERNAITQNAFINNQTQVMYVGTRFLDWSKNERGNYWSDNSAFDLNGDGISDTAYRPNGVIDQVLWRAPAAKMLINSPAVQVVRWAQSQFPAIHPGGVVDSAPLMTVPAVPAARRLAPRP